MSVCALETQGVEQQGRQGGTFLGRLRFGQRPRWIEENARGGEKTSCALRLPRIDKRSRDDEETRTERGADEAEASEALKYGQDGCGRTDLSVKKYRVAQRSLTLLDLKGYVGGLFLFDGRLLHIGSLGFRPDDASVSFTV
jgi:hypothetical protein